MFIIYRKNKKKSDAKKIAVWIIQFYCRIMYPKDAEGMVNKVEGNQVDPNQTASFGRITLW